MSSAAQVALFVAPAAALLAALVGTGLPLAFRPVEMATMAGATVVVALLVLDGRRSSWKGAALVGVYVALRRRVLDRRRPLTARREGRRRQAAPPAVALALGEEQLESAARTAPPPNSVEWMFA